VAELGTGAEPATEQRAARDDRAADTRADREHGHVANVAAGTELELGPSSRIGVVVDRDVEVEGRPQPLAQRLVAPADVRRVVHGRLVGVDEAGCRHARRRDRAAVSELADHLDDRFDDGVGVARLGRDAVLGDDEPSLVDHRTCDLGSADVDPDRVHERRVYSPCDPRSGPTPPVARTAGAE
jgi:hypothetical protein